MFKTMFVRKLKSTCRVQNQTITDEMVFIGAVIKKMFDSVCAAELVRGLLVVVAFVVLVVKSVKRTTILQQTVSKAV